MFLFRYLSISLDHDEIRIQDFITMIYGVADSSIGRDLAVNFVISNWDQILDMYDSSVQ